MHADVFYKQMNTNIYTYVYCIRVRTLNKEDVHLFGQIIACMGGSTAA